MNRIAEALADDETHKAAFLDILLNQRFARSVFNQRLVQVQKQLRIIVSSHEHS